jgi:FtsH-binding integral membrane protein
VFGLVTVYDTKKVRMFASLAMAENDSNKYAVYSAMQLYLDYINILLYMIRLLGIVGDRRN